MNENKKIWLSPPHMGGRERELVQEVFDINWISPAGPHIDIFEERLSNISLNYSVAALSSGTAAIHLALIIAGVRKNDNVICSSFTFSASANPITYLGANPIFIDSERETWNMCPNLLERAIEDAIKINKKPKAIVLVHLYGMPAKMEDIMLIANKFSIPLIEDAAEALGSKYKKQQIGTFSDFGVYSFNGNKIITTSAGGALVCKNQIHAKKARFLSTQARDDANHYEHSEVGYNYRMSNVCAAIGLGQLDVLSDRVFKKREIFNYYKDKLSSIKEITFSKENQDSFSNYWLTTILLDENSAIDRERLRLHLADSNIESRPLWKPMHLQPVFNDCKSYVNGVSEDLFERGLCLPSGTSMTKEDLDRIINKVKELYEV
tara:strand:- start:1607 stop:2740 length:1134 start_codon:yes stop_codon:yes gene_type:complete